MARPVILSPKVRWATVTAGGAEVVEPDNTHKDNGWVSAEEPPHTFFNYWMNVVYLWVAYLDGLYNEAIAWTAAHTFAQGIAVTTGGAGAALVVTGNTNQDGSTFRVFGNTAAKAAVHAKALAADTAGANSAAIIGETDTAGVAGAFSNTSTGFAVTAVAATRAIRATCSTAGTTGGQGVIEGVLDVTNNAGAAIYGTGGVSNSAGVRGTGGNSSAGGTAGGKGMEGTGGSNDQAAGVGGYGGYFSGGAQSFAGVGAGTGGTGVYALGGFVFDANTTGTPGPGGEFWGGAVFFDSHSRRGGIGVKCQGGSGQAGYGPALQATLGDVNVLAGDLNITGKGSFTDEVFANKDLTNPTAANRISGRAVHKAHAIIQLNGTGSPAFAANDAYNVTTVVATGGGTKQVIVTFSQAFAASCKAVATITLGYTGANSFIPRINAVSTTQVTFDIIDVTNTTGGGANAPIDPTGGSPMNSIVIYLHVEGKQ